MKYCEAYAALLDLFVDGELSTEDMIRVQAHLGECPACQAYVDDALAIRAAFPDTEDTEVPDGFAEGVMAAIQSQAEDSKASAGSVSPKKKKTPWVGVLASLAACCAIVILQQTGPLSARNSSTESVTCDTATAEAAVEEETAPEYAAADAGMEDEVVETTLDAADDCEPAEAAPQRDLALTEKETFAEEQSMAASASKEGLYFATLTLTAEEADTLLDRFTPIMETETELQYELSREDFEPLLSALSEAGIVPAGEVHPSDLGDTALIIVQK